MLTELYGTDSADAIVDNLVKELKGAKTLEDAAPIYNKYLPYLWQSGSSPYTVRGRYYTVKKALADAHIAKKRKSAFMALFTLDEDFYRYLNKQSVAREVEHINDKTEFSVERYIERMNNIKTMIENKTVPRYGPQTEKAAIANACAVWLAMATGRRTYEILKTLELSKRGGVVYFDGLAKKGDDQEKRPAILLDNDYQFIKKTLKKVREHFGTEGMTSKQINSKYSFVLNRAAVKFTGDEKTSMHVLRERYAEVCIKTINHDGIDDEMFRKMVLGHEVRLTATDFYKSQKGV